MPVSSKVHTHTLCLFYLSVIASSQQHNNPNEGLGCPKGFVEDQTCPGQSIAPLVSVWYPVGCLGIMASACISFAAAIDLCFTDCVASWIINYS